MKTNHKNQWWNFFAFGWLGGQKITELEARIDELVDQGNFDECYSRLNDRFPLTLAHYQNNREQAHTFLAQLREMLSDSTQDLKSLDRQAVMAYSKNLASLIEGEKSSSRIP